MDNKIDSITAYQDHEVGTDRLSDTRRTLGLNLDGKTLVSTTNYCGRDINITIHNLTYTDILKLITELTHILNSMIDAR